MANDGRGRVLDVDNQQIYGLLAAGNTTENAYAAGYPGAGATLGPIMTMGYLAGRTAAGQSASYPAGERAAALAGARP